MKKRGTKEQTSHFESFIRGVSQLSDDLIVPRAPACEPTSESITWVARGGALNRSIINPQSQLRRS